MFNRTYNSPGGSGDIFHFTSVPQVVTEQYVLDTLDEAEIDIHWESEVTTVDSSPDGIHVKTADEWLDDAPHGPHSSLPIVSTGNY
ncbi:hypothetical protein [Natrinema soli]|uniref:Uncharacterized protein n=1 Tax=Natrinema soli TaxID=1930624 RepID=A0ABD5SNH6_9EURY|nr:hypothetical protein [Natrinema soli]